MLGLFERLRIDELISRRRPEMAAEAIRLPAALEREAGRVARPVERTGPVVPLPVRSPLLDPRAVEALLLAFSPLEERRIAKGVVSGDGWTLWWERRRYEQPTES
jgi:hypothetical protein